MPIAPCPERLRKRIKRLNQESSVTTQQLKQILRDISSARAHNSRRRSHVLTLPSTVTIDLDRFTFRVSNELTDVLTDIDPPELIERIRICPVCDDLFWAGRSGKTGKKACDKHVVVLRQREYRQAKKKRKEAADAEKRKKEAWETLFAMGTIKLAVIRAIMDDGPNTFGAIDVRVWQRRDDAGERPIRRTAVRKVAHELYKAGFLEYRESADRRDACGFSRFDRYPPTVKLHNLWRDADIQELD